MLKLDDSTRVGGREKFEVEEVLKRSYSLLVYRTMHFVHPIKFTRKLSVT